MSSSLSVAATTGENFGPDDDRLTRRKVSPDIVVWLSAGILVLTIGSIFELSAQAVLFWISALGGVHALGSFWRHGGRYISAGGVFLIGLATFFYFPGVYLSQVEPDFVERKWLVVAIAATYCVQVLMYYIAWKPLGVVQSPAAKGDALDGALLWTFNTGVSLLLAGYGLYHVYGLDSTTLAGASAFVGCTMVAVAVLQSGRRLSFVRLAVAAAAFALYVGTMFSGGGRLVLGSLAMAIAIAATTERGGRRVKAALLLILPAGLVALAANRSELVATAGRTESGLESVTWPLERFAELIQMTVLGHLEHAWGSTFYASAVFFVPRSWWPEKPVGLGAELTSVFRPELQWSGHSEAALLTGEWVYNFGILGLFLMLPVTAWGINWLDRRLAQSRSTDATGRRAALGRVATIIAAAGILDLVWVGTFGYAARTGQRLMVVLAVSIVFAWRSRRQQRSKRPAARMVGESRQGHDHDFRAHRELHTQHRPFVAVVPQVNARLVRRRIPGGPPSRTSSYRDQRGSDQPSPPPAVDSWLQSRPHAVRPDESLDSTVIRRLPRADRHPR